MDTTESFPRADSFSWDTSPTCPHLSRKVVSSWDTTLSCPAFSVSPRAFAERKPTMLTFAPRKSSWDTSPTCPDSSEPLDRFGQVGDVSHEGATGGSCPKEWSTGQVGDVSHEGPAGTRGSASGVWNLGS